MDDTVKSVDELKAALTSFVNSWSLENGSDTPDFIIAAYILDCLSVFNIATRKRDEWHHFRAWPKNSKPEWTDQT